MRHENRDIGGGSEVRQLIMRNAAEETDAPRDAQLSGERPICLLLVARAASINVVPGIWGRARITKSWFLRVISAPVVMNSGPLTPRACLAAVLSTGMNFS
ncbi:hypothetical protein [Sphingopyxis sp. BSNA05]|uniref:hypothetical protein n=1 Tax=Sphingopyxis sp. BSNA05 TaxID=1236614 RepID=UPI00349F24A3